VDRWAGKSSADFDGNTPSVTTTHLYCIISHSKELFRMRKHQDILSFNRVYKHIAMCLISDFRRYEDEIWTLLRYYIAYSGSSLPTFRDPHTRRNIPEERRSQRNELCQQIHRDTRGMFAVFTFLFSAFYGGNIRYLYMA
jgi:hypothetical protein